MDINIFEPKMGGSFTAYRVECKFPDSNRWVPAKVLQLPPDCAEVGAVTPYPECIYQMLEVFGYEQAMSFAYQVLSRASSGDMEQRTRHLFVEVRVIPYTVKWGLKSKCDGEPTLIPHGIQEIQA